MSTSLCSNLLSFGKDTNIFAAGNDNKVIIYNDKGEKIKVFDYSNNNNIKEFSCCAIIMLLF